MTTDHDLVESSEFTRHRILNGVPEGADDLADMLPMDGNLDLMGGGTLFTFTFASPSMC